MAYSHVLAPDAAIVIRLRWEVQLFHGVARNNILLHYQELKLNIEELQQLHVKKYGLEDCLLILESI